MDNPFMEMLKAAPRDAKINGLPSDMTTETLEDYDLGGIDCPKCNNTGHISYYRDGILYSRECVCMNQRRSLRRIRRSGMSDMLERYTFERFDSCDEERARLKEKAQEFAEADYGWLIISGQSGSGKTHLCTAICRVLIARWKNVYYMSWRDESRSLKALMNTDEIEPKLKILKSVDVLYIDDFFKGGCSEADVRLAFEILNARYNNAKLRTIISTEMDIRQLMDIDEALAGRIYERSKGYRLQAPKENYRLRG